MRREDKSQDSEERERARQTGKWSDISFRIKPYHHVDASEMSRLLWESVISTAIMRFVAYGGRGDTGVQFSNHSALSYRCSISIEKSVCDGE